MTATANPFDAVREEIKGLRCELSHRLAQIELRLATPKPDWESLATAVKTRKKARETLVAAVRDGYVRAERRASHGGKQAYLLWREDLDRRFPVVAASS